MGCNMCVVNRPEEQYRVMFQKGYLRNSLRPMDGHTHTKVRGRRASQLPQDRPPNSQDPLLLQGGRKGHRRKAGNAIGSSALVSIPDCVDNATQTDISFQNILTLGRGSHSHPAPPPPSPPLPHFMEPYAFKDFGMFDQEFNDPNDYFDIAHHEVDRQEELEYEEVELSKSSQQDKLGLTVCYRTDDEEDLGIYVGEVNPNSIAAMNGRIREGDRILQINGIDIQNREEAVAILTQEDTTNISLLLARPEIENENLAGPDDSESSWIPGARADDYHLPHLYRLRRGPLPRPDSPGGGLGGEGEGEQEGEEGLEGPEPDSGVGRTDESTRYEESSEHDLLEPGNTDATNTPGSARHLSHAPYPHHQHHLQRHELQLSSDSLPGLEGGGAGGGGVGVGMTTMMMPGLTEEECERYRELLEIKCQYERSGRKGGKGAEPSGGGGEKREGEEEEGEEEGLTQHEIALLEEELRHLEFKCRNILRAQKMQQLRERCLKAWLLEEEAAGRGGGGHGGGHAPEEPDDPTAATTAGAAGLHRELSDINEAPERLAAAERSDRESTSAYNTGGESCRSTPLVSTERLPPLSVQEEGGPESSPSLLLPLLSPLSPLSRHRERRRGGPPSNCSFSPNSYRKFQTTGGGGGPGEAGSRRGVAEGGRRGSRDGDGGSRLGGGRSAESSPYFPRRSRGLGSGGAGGVGVAVGTGPLERYQSCLTLPSNCPTALLEPLERRGRGRGRGAGGEEEEEEEEERGAAAGCSSSSIPDSPRSVSSAPAGPARFPSPAHSRHRRLALALPLSVGAGGPAPPNPASSPRMEWKVKVRSDGTRYVAKRPVRDRLLKARAIKIREERSGATTDDDAVSEMKMGRYWSKEERKRQLARAREQRRRREFMAQSRLDYLKGGRAEGEGGRGRAEWRASWRSARGRVVGGGTGGSWIIGSLFRSSWRTGAGRRTGRRCIIPC